MIDLINSKCILRQCFGYTVWIDLFKSKYFLKITAILVDSFDPTSNIKSTVSINLIDSQGILRKFQIYTVSINLFESKFLPTANTITTVQVDSLDPTSMSEKISILTSKLFFLETNLILEKHHFCVSMGLDTILKSSLFDNTLFNS